MKIEKDFTRKEDSMKKVTKDWLENGEGHSFYLIGDKDSGGFYPAIIGIARNLSHVVYSAKRANQTK